MLNFIKPEYKKIFKNKKLILFDMDGTVTKTETFNHQIYKSAIDKILDIKLSPKDWNKFFSGRTPNESLTKYLEKYGILLTNALLKNLMEELRVSKKKQLENISNIEIVDGFIEFAKNLKEENFRIGLVTSTTREFVGTILTKSKINRYFDQVITREDCNNISKPSPAIYLQAMKIFGIEPKYTIIFEDSSSGLMAAIKSGAAVIQIAGQLNKLNGVSHHIENYLAILCPPQLH